MERLPNIHPGDLIRDDFMVPMRMTAYQLAKGLNMTQTAVTDIPRGRRAVTALTAAKLARFLGCSARFWLGLPAAYDLEDVELKHAAALSTITRHPDLPEISEESLLATAAEAKREAVGAAR